MKSTRHLKNSAWLKFTIFAILGLLALPFLIGSPVETLTCLGLAGSMNMLDLSKANDSDVIKPIIEEAVGAFPESTSIATNQLGAGELSYQTLTRDGYPSVSFHDMGAGLIASKSKTRLERFECFPIGGRVQAPRHMADNWKRGGAAGYFAFEALGIMKAAIFTMAKQIWYGRVSDAKGFPGLKNFTAYGTTATDPLTSKTFNLSINATGTTANTASSCYLVVSNADNVEIQFGTGNVFDLPEPRIADYVDPNDSTKTIEGYVSVLQGFAGLQTPNVHCVRRIYNLTDDSGKGMTDALLAKALKEFPQGVRPTGIYMSTFQRYKLQLSRTVVLNGQGSQRPDQPAVAPIPTDYDGIPIYATDAIADTDAIESAALSEE